MFTAHVATQSGRVEIILFKTLSRSHYFVTTKAASCLWAASLTAQPLTEPCLLVLDGDVRASSVLVLASNEVGDLLVFGLLQSGLQLGQRAYWLNR